MTGAAIVGWIVGPALGWLAYGLAYKAGRKHGYFIGWLHGSRVTLETVAQTVTPESFTSRMPQLIEMSRNSQKHLTETPQWWKWSSWLKGAEEIAGEPPQRDR